MSSIHTESMNYFIRFLKERSAIVLTNEKRYLVELRLAPVAQHHGYSCLNEFIGFLSRSHDKALHQQVIEAMTIHETYFFRDTAFFDSLRDYVFPELIKRRSANKQLNIWCGASSSGQEPYSVLMLLHEHFPEVFNWSLKFMATDISSRMIERSKNALYSELEVARGAYPHYLQRYFDKHPDGWKIKDKLSRVPDFFKLNLIDSWPQMPQMDVIFLRNVLIYFDVETKQQILKNVRRILKPDGYLFLGTSETTLNLDSQFERVAMGKADVYRLRAEVPLGIAA